MQKLKVCLCVVFCVGVLASLGGVAPLQAQSLDYLYWANLELGFIGRASLDGNVIEPYFINLGTAPWGIAVDQEFVYWADHMSRIGRAKLDNTGGVNLNFVQDCLDPFAVAVDDKYIYWTNLNLPNFPFSPSVGRAKLDGTEVTQNFILLPAGYFAAAIAVSKEFIYMGGGEESHPSIMRAKLDGTELDLHWIEGATKPLVGAAQAIALTETHLYWSNGDGNPYTDYIPFISRADLSGDNAQVVVMGEKEWSGIWGLGTKGDFIYWGEYSRNRIGRANIDGSAANPDWISGTGFCSGIAFAPQRYTFDGFFSPIDNPPTVNNAKAGQTISVKWRLTDKNGLPVSDPASFTSITSTRVGCASLAEFPINYVDELATGSSGLQYLGDGWWQFNWKTPKTYAGQCRTMKLTLNDGSAHTASFQFK